MAEEIKEQKPIISVKNARKIYRMGDEKIVAVDNVSFDVYKGEFCCLLGQSGSGKSTLLNLMAGIEKLTKGDVFIKGKNIRTMNETQLALFRQKNLGFVFQSYNLMGTMTAQENVEFPMVFKRVKKKEREKAALKILKQVGLEKRVGHKPKEMSGGQQQRVGIARAFVTKPAIVFADEPTGNLDTTTTREVMDIIKDIARENNETIIMVTHEPELTSYADRVITISDGRVVKIELHGEIIYSEEHKDIAKQSGKEEIKDTEEAKAEV